MLRETPRAGPGGKQVIPMVRVQGSGFWVLGSGFCGSVRVRGLGRGGIPYVQTSAFGLGTLLGYRPCETVPSRKERDPASHSATVSETALQPSSRTAWRAGSWSSTSSVLAAKDASWAMQSSLPAERDPARHSARVSENRACFVGTSGGV